MATTLIQQKLVEYVSTPNGLNYNPEDIYCDPSRQDEIDYIAQFLCGSNKSLAINFMLGSTSDIRAKTFFENVEYNGNRSNPVIVKAIQIHLQNRGKGL